MGTVKIMYVGNKPIKKDTIANTGAIWNGRGDVQAISDEPTFSENGKREPMTPAQRLLSFPFVWVVATDEAVAAIKKSNALQAKADAAAKEAKEAQAEVDRAAKAAMNAAQTPQDHDDPADSTVDEIKDKLFDMDMDELVAMARAEEEGKNRKGVLEAIKAEIESR